MKIKIDRLIERTISTKYGDKQKLSIQSDGKWYGAWKNQHCQDWTEGMEVEVEVKERQYQDKNGVTQTGYDIVFPKGGQVDLEPLKREIADIKIMVEEIFKAVCTRQEDVPDPPQF